MRKLALILGATALTTAAQAAELEVTHWWTSGGEAAAVAEFAKAFNEGSDHTWVDGAIAGGGSTARPIVVSRIIGGDPMGAFQFNHGRQTEELIENGLLRDMTHVAEAEGWADIVNPPSLLEACTVDGRIYCAPVNIHSWQWLWLSHAAFEAAGVAVPTNWDEFVAGSGALRDAGKLPLALGGQSWQSAGLFNVLMVGIAGPDVLVQIYGENDTDLAGGDVMARVFKAAADAREMATGSTVQDWNQATNLVITGAAGGQVMGDWAQGEFQVAGQTAGEDYTCLPGLGINELIDTAGDAFFLESRFPKHSKHRVIFQESTRRLFSPENEVVLSTRF